MADLINNTLSAAKISASISQGLVTYEAGRSAFFSFKVPSAKLAALPKSDSIANDEGTLGAQVAEYLELNVVSSSVPHFELEELSYRRANDVVKFAGVPIWNDGQIKIDDVIGLDTKSILKAWQEAAYNPRTRKGGAMKDYKFDCYLIEYTQSGEEVRIWTLYGCWIKGLSEADFDKENDSKRQITATIVYDRAELSDGAYLKANRVW